MTHNEFLAQPTSKYSYWFGDGDSHDDYQTVTKDEPLPAEVFLEEHMLCIIWPDKIIVTGYDGNEYHHTFTFKREAL